MKPHGTIRLMPDGSTWEVETEPHVLLKLKRVFAGVATRHGKPRLPNSPSVCRELAWFCDRYPHEVVGREVLERGAAHAVKLEARFAALAAGTAEPRHFDLAIPLRQYQAVAAEAALTARGLLLADEVGLGKTATSIATLMESSSRPALVVCYPHLQRQWAREIARFAPGMVVHTLRKAKPYPIDGLVECSTTAQIDLVPPRCPDVILSSWHKLDGWCDVLAGRMRTVIFDEVQELRRRESAKYLASKAIASKADLRIGLSATPIYNYGDEFFAVLDVLRPGELGSWSEFSQEWCDYGRAIKSPAAFGSFLRDSGMMLRRTRRDVARELPALSVVEQEVTSDPRWLHEVDDAAAQLAAVILGDGVRGFDKMQAAQELDWKLRQATGVGKAPSVAAFVRLLVESGEKVVLFGWHRDVYAVWMDALKDLAPVLFTGSETPAQKQKSVDAFVSGDAKVLVMSLRAGAGIDGIQAVCSTVVFGELDWSPGVHAQCIGRVHRDGQGSPVVAYYALANDGSDPVIADVLGIKDVQLQGVRDGGEDVVKRLEIDPAHIRTLAERYLSARKGAKARPERELEEVQDAA